MICHKSQQGFSFRDVVWTQSKETLGQSERERAG